MCRKLPIQIECAYAVAQRLAHQNNHGQCLPTHHDDEKSGILKFFDGLLSPGDKFKIGYFVKVVLLNVDGSVTVKKDCASFIDHGGDLTPDRTLEFYE